MATALTGTITSTGIALAGTGTQFTTELAIGKLILDPASNSLRAVTKITSNTVAEIASAFPSDVSGATLYTGTAAIYRTFKKRAMKKEIDLTADTIKAYLLTGSYTFSQSHEFVSDLGANVLKTVTLAGVTVDQPNPGTVDCNDHVFTAVNGSFAAVVYAKDTGVAGTSPLIYYTDLVAGFPGSITNGSVNVNVDSGTDRLFTI